MIVDIETKDGKTSLRRRDDGKTIVLENDRVVENSTGVSDGDAVIAAKIARGRLADGDHWVAWGVLRKRVDAYKAWEAGRPKKN